MPRTPRWPREGSSSSAVASSVRRSPLAFVVLVATLSMPFWLAGSLTDWQLLEGLSASSFMFLCPWGRGRS